MWGGGYPRCGISIQTLGFLLSNQPLLSIYLYTTHLDDPLQQQTLAQNSIPIHKSHTLGSAMVAGIESEGSSAKLT